MEKDRAVPGAPFLPAQPAPFGAAGAEPGAHVKGNWTPRGACATESAMNDKPASAPAKPSKPGRDARLKAALKANMARRKAQARARTLSRSADSDDKAED